MSRRHTRRARPAAPAITEEQHRASKEATGRFMDALERHLGKFTDAEIEDMTRRTDKILHERGYPPRQRDH